MKNNHSEISSKKLFSPLELLDYICAILNSPSYRKKYRVFLKKGFPKVPYPKNQLNYKLLVNFGKELRLLQ